MLHIVHLIERRFPQRSHAVRWVAATASVLALGVGLALL